MPPLNYNHLYYFWTVAKEGSIAAACRKLDLTQPTISAQLRELERSLGAAVFARAGRGLQMTDAGRTAFRYADEIFTLGRELTDVLRGRTAPGELRLLIGVADAMPKRVAHRLIAPVFTLPERVRFTCLEGTTEELVARMSVNELDVILADAPLSPHVKLQAFSHPVGACGVAVFGTARLAARHRRQFPASLESAPFLLPTMHAMLRRSLDHWFDEHGVHPATVGEFDDAALLKSFAESGAGLFAAPLMIEDELLRLGLRRLGVLEGVTEQYFAISVERKVRHPAVLAITSAVQPERSN